MSFQRRALLIGLALVLTAGLFFFVQLGPDDSESEAASDAPTASASADVDPEVGERFATARKFVEDADDVTLVTASSAGTEDSRLQFTGDEMTGFLINGSTRTELLKVDGVSYIRGPAELWTRGLTPEQAAQIADKWVPIDAENASLGPFLQFTDRTTFVAGFLQAAPSMRDSGPSDELGTQTETVTLDTGGQVTVYHFDAETGAPVALQSADGLLTFSFDPVDAPAKPADSEIAAFPAVP